MPDEPVIGASPHRSASPTYSGEDVSRTQSWFEGLLQASGTARQEDPTQEVSATNARLLFVLDNDYGELTTLMYFLAGQDIAARSTVLLPGRLHEKNGDALPGRTHRWQTEEDILRAVESHAPHVVLFCSGYLFAIHGLLTAEGLDRLVNLLERRGIRVATADPYLGILSLRDPRESVSIDVPEDAPEALQVAKRSADDRLHQSLVSAERTFRACAHLYPSYPDATVLQMGVTDERNVSFYNPHLIVPAPPASENVAVAANTPHWVFIISAADLDTQGMFEGPSRVPHIIADKLLESVAAGRHPILIAPDELVAKIEVRLAGADGVTLLTFCPFTRVIALLLTAEYAFYWNVVSHSILVRLFNGLPVVLFDRGHLARAIKPMYERVIAWYYQGWRPPYVSHHEPLTLEAVRRVSDDYQRNVEGMRRGFERAPSPSELVETLLARASAVETSRVTKISIETPVFKGDRLQRCIDSVLYQSSPDWTFSLLWDGGDAESRRILEELDRRKLPGVTVHFGENRGIARARRFLTEHSDGEYLLPLDDDDALPFNAVERFLVAAKAKPWASVIRGQRKIIDESGKVLDTPPWFPFEPRHYQQGMVTDLMNHSQPYLIKRSAYDRTTGWDGFEDFSFAGEDCDIYLKLEEVGTVELIDETLYYYRVHANRQSLVLTNEAAFEMWRRLADRTIARIGLPLRRTNETPPFTYELVARPAATLAMVDFIVLGGEAQVESLMRAGIDEAALHRAEGASARALDEAWRRTSRPMVCLMGEGIELDEPFRGMHTLLRVMHEESADLAAPKLLTGDGRVFWANPGFSGGPEPVSCRPGGSAAQRSPAPNVAWLSEQFALVRREVFNAVGGFDDGYGDLHMAMVDFCLRARQRRFRCIQVSALAFTFAGAAPRGDRASVDRMRRKWIPYPELLV